MSDAENGRACIVDGALVIRVPLENFHAVIECAWMMCYLKTRFKITDINVFAAELVRQLNREDEQGTTPVHMMFDRCINEAIEQGAEGVEEHEIQIVF